ncbi:MAG: glycosyltransferase family 2 protein [Acidobacteriota bacterium]
MSHIANTQNRASLTGTNRVSTTENLYGQEGLRPNPVVLAEEDREGIGKVPSLSVVIPVYNSEALLCDLLQRLVRVLETSADQYEVILVNDASRDRSWKVICDLAAQYENVSGINLMRNFGQHNALLCGIRAAKHEVIVTMDDDLQHPPEEVPKLLRELNKGFDVVYGTPQREQHGLWRDLASQMTKLALQSAMGVNIARQVSAFRAFRTEIRNAFATYQSTHVSIDVLLTWGTTRFAALPVHHDPRRIGVSNYTFYQLLRHAMNMLTGFSAVPLQLASFIGFAFTLFGGGVLLYVVGRYFIQGVVMPGFAFLASIIAIFSGAQLFALGIVGEYLARMHFRMMERPAYIIRHQVLSRQQKKS